MLASQSPSLYPVRMNDDSPSLPKPTITGILFVVFLRLVAISCFWFGLEYWAMLVGYSLHGAARFDLLDLPWRVATVGLAVAFPVAALGLWLTVSWGPVIWVVAAGGQMLMYGLWNAIYGSNMLLVLQHGCVAVLYCVFRLLLSVEARKQRGRITVGLP